jgi:hypothetical protein
MIKVTEDLRITSNSTSWMVEKRNTVKDEKSENFGKEIWQNVGNYGKISHCFNKILDIKRKELSEKTISIEKFLKQDAELREWIVKMFEPLADAEKEQIEE